MSAKTNFPKEELTHLEQEIDKTDWNLPKLTNFILPGGGVVSAQIHVCRTVCRRAERKVVAVEVDSPQSVEPCIIQYLNRLSDYFFVLARHATIICKQPETIYKKSHIKNPYASN